jgi:hypothetical protein
MPLFIPLREILLAAVATLSPQGAAPETELGAMAAQIRSFTPRDKFDSLPALPSVAGRRFSVVVAPLERGSNNSICSGFPSWGYLPQRSHYEVGSGTGTGLKRSFEGPLGPIFATGSPREPALIEYLSFTCSHAKEPAYTTTNGFGAQVQVEKTTDTVTAIAYDYDKPTSWKDYWETTITGDAARQLAKNVRVRISGVLSDWSPGTPIKCGVSRRHPTMALPIDRTLNACLFNGRIDRFEVFNVATGELLYSAGPPEPKKRR